MDGGSSDISVAAFFPSTVPGGKNGAKQIDMIENMSCDIKDGGCDIKVGFRFSLLPLACTLSVLLASTRRDGSTKSFDQPEFA
jgi:hypothetical protein